MRHHPTAAAAAEELAAGATYAGLHRAVRRQPLKSWTRLEADVAAAAAAEVAVAVAAKLAPPRRMHLTYVVKGGAQSRQRRRLMTPLTRFGMMMMMMVMTTKMTLMSLRVLWRQRRRFVDDFHQSLSHATR